MSEVRIVYSSLEDAVECASKARTKIDNYITQIGKTINAPISNLNGSDSYGYAQSAANLASQKTNDLAAKKTYFVNLENSLNSVISTAKSVDSTVATNISSIAEGYIEKRKWYEAAGDWIYNTFCVDLANHFSLVRDFVDGMKWVGDKVGNVLDKVHDWFKYGDGKYVWKITTALVGIVVAAAGTIAAICAIPFSGGLSIPLVIGCIGALATSIGAIITIGNSLATIYTNGKALTLSGDFFDDDDGNPGAARYYGSAGKISEMYEKFDYGDKATNEKYEKRGRVIDKTKVIADTTAFVCNIASLGNVKDYRVTTRNDNINFRYNKDKWYKGYSFTWSNIKRNILHDMGRTATTGEFKDGSFKIKLTSTDKVSKYSVYFKDKKFELGKLTFNFSKETYSIPEKLVKFFNVTKTTDNTMNFLKNVDGLYDFYTESDKSLGGSIKALKNVTGIGKNSKVFSIFDKYGTKTVKTIEDVVGLIGG